MGRNLFYELTTLSMNEELLRLQRDLSSLRCKNELVSVVIYGSTIYASSVANDLDIIIVVKKINSDLCELFDSLFKKYKNIDFNLYTYQEITNGLSYFTREFKLEYQAEGICLFGENILKNEFNKISEYSYKRSILIRSLEHLQMVRKVYFSQSFDDTYKMKYLEKYFQRISKNILLFNSVGNHASINKLKTKEVVQKLIDEKIIINDLLINDMPNMHEYLELFEVIGEYFIKCKNEFEN